MAEIQWEVLLIVIGMIAYAVRTEIANRRQQQELQTARDEMQIRKAEVEAEMDTRERDIELKAREWFQDRVSQLENANDRLNERLSKTNAELNEMSLRNTKLDVVVASLRERVEELKTNIRELKEEIKAYQRENGQLISENAKLHKDVSYERSEKARIERLNNQYLMQINEQSERIRSLEAELDKLDKRLAQQESIIETQSRQILRLENGSSHTANELPELSDETAIVKVNKTENENAA